MQRTDLVSNLPVGPDYELNKFIDAKLTVNAMAVCKSWQTFFNKGLFWQHRIEKDFAISNQTFVEFNKLLSENDNINYREMYIRLYIFKHQPKLPKHLTPTLRDQSYHLQLLASAANNIAISKKFIPGDELPFWQTVAIYLHCTNIGNVLANPYAYLDDIANAGNVVLLKKLMEEKKVKPTNSTWNTAIVSKQKKMIQFLLVNSKTDVDFKVIEKDKIFALNDLALIQKILDQIPYSPTSSGYLHAIESDNSEIVDYFLNRYPELPDATPTVSFLSAILGLATIELVKRYEEKISKIKAQIIFSILQNVENGNPETFNYFLKLKPTLFNNYSLRVMFKQAMKSGKKELVEFFLNTEFKHADISFAIDENLLDRAALSGDITFFKYIHSLNPKLQPDIYALRNAIKSLNYDLIFWFLDKNNGFGIIPDIEILKLAANKGLDTIVRFLIKHFSIAPNQEVLLEAIHSGNIKLIQFLLAVENNFGLIFTKEMQTLMETLHEKNPFMCDIFINPNTNTIDLEAMNFIPLNFSS